MRYLPLTEADRAAMLAAIGLKDVEALFEDVPQSARLSGPIAELPMHQGELAVERVISGMAAKNVPAGSVPSFLGAGAYRHHIPATVDHMIQRGEFLTSYTPYQPEISQGTLQYLFEFQTQVAMITGMEIANASLYDGATACAEAVMMANRVTKRRRAVLSGGLHPQYGAVTATNAHFVGFEVAQMAPDVRGTEELAPQVDDTTSCVVVQTPSVFGHPHDLTELAAVCHAKGALLVAVVTEPVSLGLLTPPGEMGADIVCGEGQGIGNPLTFGGPYVGLFATRQKHVRQMPGRLCGQTTDADGKRGFVLTLSTREQHIRREKATSNICTNSGLCALAFTIHMSLLGETGFRQLAALNHHTAVTLAEKLSTVPGVEVVNDGFFNEFTLRLRRPADAVVERLAARNVLAGVPACRLFPKDEALSPLLLVTATETNTEAEMDALCGALREEMRR